ncbi:RHS repeat protein [Luteimonas sp. A611]
MSLYNGATEFTATDIDVPGNSALPVRLTRRMKVELYPVGSEGGPWNSNLKGAGDWDVDVPYIAASIPSSGWADTRCSVGAIPSATGFESLEFWQGNTVHVPGESDRSMLLPEAQTPLPAAGGPYKWTSRERDVFTCIPMQSGLSGEGFSMQTVGGLKYTFNVAASRYMGVMKRQISIDATQRVTRTKYYLLASKVEDRFGNFVEYEYNGDGNPEHISSSDGRQILLTYTSGRLSSASAHGRTWIYQYGTGTNANWLATVTLPDGARWQYARTGSLSPIYVPWDGGSNATCNEQPPAIEANYSLSITHPSGAVGTFEFTNQRQYRSGVHRSECLQRVNQSHYYYVLNTPNFFDVMALTSKSISGPGLANTLQWEYAYGGEYYPLWGGGGAAAYPCTTCPEEKQTTLIEPDGTARVHRYGVLYSSNEGRLLGTTVRNGNGATQRTDVTEYLPESAANSQTFHPRYGLIINGDDPSTARVRPVVSQATIQDGVTFNTTIPQSCGSSTYCFDLHGRATRAVKSSTLPSSPSRTEATTYHDNLAKWILGQVAQVTCTASTPANPACDGAADSVMSQTTYDATWALPQVSKHFGRTVQTLGYDTSSSIASGQRGTVTSVTDGNGKVTTLGSWKRGIPQSIRYPATPEATAGATQAAVVNDSGWIMSTVDEAGFTTAYGYDAMGRLSLIDYPDDDSVVWHNTTLAFEPVAGIEYGIPAGHWRQTISTGNARKVSYFDALWRPLVVREYDTANASGTQRFSRFTYDHEGRVTFASHPGTSDALSTGTWTWYDALGRPTQITQDSELGALTTGTEYLAGFKTRVTPPRGQPANAAFQTTTSYLAWDQPTTDLPVAIAHPAGAFTDIGRDVFGKPTAITRRNSSGSVALTRSYVYDAYQQLCKSVEPETGATIMAYDNAGNLAWSKAGATQTATGACNTADIPAAQRTTRTYDGRNWLRTLSFPDGRGNQSWTYTRDGLPATINTQNSGSGDVVTNSYSYNRRRLIEGETFAVGSQLWALDYNYNQHGHLADHASPGVVVDLAPNALGQPSKAGTYATAVSYYPNGGIKQFTYGNGIKHTLSQNTRGLPVTSCDFVGSSCTASAVLRDSYDYDQHGNVAAISDGRTGSRGHRDMTYDVLDRLTQAVSPMFGTANYTYTVLDNLQTVQVTGGPKARNHTYVYDARNQLTNVTNTSGGATVIGLGYDPQGNVQNKNGVTYTFDQGNRLRQGAGEQYRYDGHGRRVLSTRDDRNIYSLYGQDGTLRFQRDEHTGKTTDYVHLGGSLVAQVENAIALSTPTLTVPGSSMTGSYIISWGTSALATKYQVQERLDSGSWATIHNAAGNSKSITGKAAGAWGYRVRACSPATCGSWSAEKTVAVQLAPTAVPTLTVPTTGPNGGFTVSWTAVPAANVYQLQERQGSGSWSSYPNSSALSRAISGKAAGSWSYQVRACNDAGCGSWSAIKSVNVLYPPAGPPTLTLPATNLTGSYTASWTAIATASRYELDERLGTAAWTQIHNAAGISKALSGKTTGSWGYRIRACNDAGCSAYAAEKVVAVTRPPTAAPTLTVPASNTTGSYSVSWTAVATATSYGLQERPGTGSWITLQANSATSRAISGKATGSWGYQVRACNEAGCGAYSTVKAVQVTRPPGTPTITYSLKTQTYVGALTHIRCEVRWTSMASATSYELQAYGGAVQYTGPLTTVAGPGNSSAYCAPSHVVRACNLAGCSAWSAPPAAQETIVIGEPGNPGDPPVVNADPEPTVDGAAKPEDTDIADPPQDPVADNDGEGGE